MNCETTCPSGVNYGELVEIGRDTAEHKKLRNFISGFKRWIICTILPFPNRFKPFYLIAKLIGATPKTEKPSNKSTLSNAHEDKVILLDGCVQSVASPNINNALNDILVALNIQPVLFKTVSCCGAIQHHNGQPEKSLASIKKNIDHWWPEIENGCSAIIMSASGCGSMVKDYYRLLKFDENYAHKAKIVSEMTKDASEYFASMNLRPKLDTQTTIAFHPPCTLQHDQKIINVVETILRRAGYQLTEFKDKHLCCGSAGTYSILQPELANQLRENKITNIERAQPDIIATANIGCLLHLQKGSTTPVMHWLNLVTINNE